MPSNARPRAVLVMSGDALAAVFTPGALTILGDLVELTGPRPISAFDGQSDAVLATAEVMITGWGAPRIDARVLDAAPRLRAIVHSAGTVKTFLAEEAFRRGILVSSSAAANAVPVAEFTVAAIVFGLKRAGRFTHQLRTTHGHRDLTGMPEVGANGVTVGLVGASRVGRETIRLLHGYDVRVVVSDPYLDAAGARALGVERLDLDELCLVSDVLSLHAPMTASTRHLIDARRLALLRDGAVVINTARGGLVDTDALTAELVSGRLDAHLDVTDPEPLPVGSPLYDLPNVTLTPHIAGALGNEVHRLGDSAVAEVGRLLTGTPLAHEIRLDDLSRIA